MNISKNDDWIIDAGDLVLEKRADGAELTEIERLVYCLWVADYSMKNAGDLEAAKDLYPNFMNEGFSIADKLKLKNSFQLFAKTQKDFESKYFEQFDLVCEEIKTQL